MLLSIGVNECGNVCVCEREIRGYSHLAPGIGSVSTADILTRIKCLLELNE